MRLQQSRTQYIKNYLHATQATLIFLAIILSIAVYTRRGASSSRTGWYFGVCWLTIPALIYLVMVPMWSRTQRFANPYCLVTLDILYTILWLSAWTAVASYVSVGGGCSDFSLGSNGKCKLSEGTVVLGVFVMTIFGGTSYLSIRTAMEYRRTGMMPSAQKPNDFEVQANDAFSSNMHREGFEEDAESRRGSCLTHEQEAQAPFDPTYGQSEHYAPLYQAKQNDEDLGQAHLSGLGVRYNSPSVVHHDNSYMDPYGDRRLP